MKSGEGEPVLEERESAAPFDNIVLSGPVNLKVDSDEKEQSVAVRAQPNLQDNIKTEIRDKTLHIETVGSFQTTNAPTVLVNLDGLESLSIMGSGDAQVKDLAQDSFISRIQGSGSVEAFGQVANLSSTISGSGDFKGLGLIADNVTARIAGSGENQIGPSQYLEASIAGSGNISYAGSPAVSQSIAGSGSISRR